MSQDHEPRGRVAVVGAGPSGLVVAKYLSAQGFTPVVFEKSNDLGGQWNASSAASGVWPAMRINTSRLMTCFSDLPYPPGTVMHPPNQEVHAYLHRYAEQFGLTSQIQLQTSVERIESAAPGEGWRLRSVDMDGKTHEDVYRYVVVASGRFNKPRIPAVPGLESFSGPGGVIHAFHYKDPGKFRGLRVLVAGCSISALEIASDLAMLGASRVVTTARRQRYILQKVIAGIPNDHLAFTRFGALAGETFPMEVVARQFKDFILRTSGSPEQWGAPKPADNVFEASITQSQHYLPLVAEGRITPRPWIDSIAGDAVRFTDGSTEEFDAIVFTTGYDLHLPFLSARIKQTLDLDDRCVDLHNFTFHPELPGLAFLGIYQQSGPYFPVLELQARWIAYVWGGAVPAPSLDELAAGIAACRARRDERQDVIMHAMAILFARAAGVEPDVRQWPELARALLFGPLSPMSFRLSGPESLDGAAAQYAVDAATFGAIPSPEFSAEQIAQIEALVGARKEAGLANLVHRRGTE